MNAARVKTLRHRARYLLNHTSRDDYWTRSILRAYLKLTTEPKFRHGVWVKLKHPKKGQTRIAGVIRNKPGPRARLVYVVWPNGWAGHCHISDLAVVRAPER